MAKQVKLSEAVTLNDIEYKKDTVLSVSDEIAADLFADNLAEEYVVPKGKEK